MRATFAKIALVLMAVLSMSSCHSIEEWDNTGVGNFEALWQIVDEHYCFFKEKDIDWNAIHDKYLPAAKTCKTERQLFGVCADMLAELKDGHVNLSSWFETSYYRQWWSDYPQNFDARVIEENYFNFQYKNVGGIMYAILPENVGYMRYSSFNNTIGESNLDAVLSYFAACNGLIIDVRDNGGGALTNVETLVRRFINEKTLVGYISHKTGKGHDDFSEPYAYYFYPTDGRIGWIKPVVVLANRSTFSAANNFVSVMKLLPGVKIVGATTGGGSGIPLSSELPCGWGIRMSACSVLDAQGNTTEFGVEPTEGCAVDITLADQATGRDTILDRAIAEINYGTWN